MQLRFFLIALMAVSALCAGHPRGKSRPRKKKVEVVLPKPKSKVKPKTHKTKLRKLKPKPVTTSPKQHMVMPEVKVITPVTQEEKPKVEVIAVKPKPIPPVKVYDEKWEFAKENQPSAYTAEFTIKRDGNLDGKVIREGIFTPRYSYTLYDKESKIVASALTRIVSAGLLFHGMTDLDVWDGEENYIGRISGQCWNSSCAKFVFTNGTDEEIASTYHKPEKGNFIVTMGGEQIGSLSGNTNYDPSNFTLTLKSNFPEQRLLKIFSAFISDYHDYFPPILF